MSASAINAAPSPAPGATAPTTSSAGGSTQSVTGKGPLTGFEALLEALTAIQAGAADAAYSAAPNAGGGKVSAKTAGDGKAAAGDGKAKSDDDSAAAVVDATAVVTPDPTLTALAAAQSLLPAQSSSVAVQVAEAHSEMPAGPGHDAPPGAVIAAAAHAANQAPGLQVLPDGPNVLSVTPAAAATDRATDANAKVAEALAVPVQASAKTQPTSDIAPPTPQPAAAPAAATAVTTAATTPATSAQQVAGELPAPPAAAAAAAAEAKPAGPVTPATPGERVQATRTAARIDITKVGATAGAAAALTAKAADALQSLADTAPKAGPLVEDEPEAAGEAHSQDGAASQAPADAIAPATASTTTPAGLIHAAAVAVRGAPQTVANLAAQIVKKLDGRASQFDVQLDPAGLGKVDVRIAIAADGRMSAAMSFDTPQAAAELRARAGELHHAMEQAGFDLTGGMSFDVAGDRGQGQGGQAQNQPSETGAVFRGRAFQAALDTTADTAPPQLPLRRAALAGVDIRI